MGGIGQTPAWTWVRTPRRSTLRDEVAVHTTPHEVTQRDDRLDGTVGVLALPESRMVFVQYGGRVEVEAPPTGDRIVATVPLGPMGVRYTDGRPGTRDTQTVVLGQECSTLMDPDPHAGALVISSDPIRIREHAHTVLGSDITLDPEPQAMTSPRVVERACRQIWTVTSTLPADTPASVIASLAHALDDMVMSALVLAWSPTRHVPTPRGHVAHVLDWIRCNHGISVTVSDIARAVGLSVRQLQQSVHDELGMTPMKLLRDVRLMDAHHRLRAASPQSSTVAAIAHDSGFAHLGRFSVMYRERFGESPSVTLMRDAAQ